MPVLVVDSVVVIDGEFFPTFPLIPGHELAGEVVEVGSEVKELRPGDRVMVDPTVTCEECHFCMTQRQNHCLGRAAMLAWQWPRTRRWPR